MPPFYPSSPAIRPGPAAAWCLCWLPAGGGAAVAGCGALLLPPELHLYRAKEAAKLDLGLSAMGWSLPEAQLEFELKEFLGNQHDVNRFRLDQRHLE